MYTSTWNMEYVSFWFCFASLSFLNLLCWYQGQNYYFPINTNCFLPFSFRRFFPTSNWDTETEKGTQTVNAIVLVELNNTGADVNLDDTSEEVGNNIVNFYYFSISLSLSKRDITIIIHIYIYIYIYIYICI